MYRKKPKTIDVKKYKGAPVFYTDPVDEGLQRIYGYKKLRKKQKVIFPAYLPFFDYVISDFETVYDDDEVSWTPVAKSYIEKVQKTKDYIDANQIPPKFEFKTEPYDHQKEAFVKTLYNYRWSLFLDCGLGKTKIACDVIRALKMSDGYSSTLVLCPPFLVNNWGREIKKHSFKDELDVLLMADKRGKPVKKQKRHELYVGKRKKAPPEDSWHAKEFPNIDYQGFENPLPQDLEKEFKELEREYLEATREDDSKRRKKARKDLRKKCKKYGIEYPDTARDLGVFRPANDYDVIVMSYSIMRNDSAWILKYLDYECIIADESHYIKSGRSKRTKKALEISKKAARRYIMSGTPSLGKPEDMYGQMKFLGDYVIPDWWQFKNRHIVESKWRKHMIVGYRNIHILNDIVDNVSTRRKKDECLDLPEQQIIDKPVYLDSETKKKYNNLVKENALNFADAGPLKAEKGVRLNKLLQILSGFVIRKKEEESSTEALGTLKVKTEESEIVEFDQTPRLNVFEELVDNILEEEKNKIIVWCKFTKELDMVQNLLREKGVNHVRVDGQTKDKTKAEKRFNHDSVCRIYLAQCSTGEGLTLNAANYMIWYGLTYSYREWKQALQRNHRIGQDKKTTVYRLYTPDSVQSYILDALDQKRDVAESITDEIACATCAMYSECQKKGIEPFKEGCIYNMSEDRVVTKPAVIE